MIAIAHKAPKPLPRQFFFNQPHHQRPTLRGYQLQVVRDYYDCIRAQKKRSLIVAGTGAGKTVIAGQIAHDAMQRAKKILFVVHREVLIEQTINQLLCWIPGQEIGAIKSGYGFNLEGSVQVSSIQSLPKIRHWEAIAFDLIIYDEAHTTAFYAISQELRDRYPNAYHLHLTATPRLMSKKRSLGDICDSLVLAPFPLQLMQEGHLSPLRYMGYDDIDLSGVASTGGDYQEAQLSLVCNTPGVTAHAVAEWHRLASDRLTVAFCVDVQHSLAVCQAFKDSGISAIHVDGKTRNRDRIYQQFRHGEYQVLTSCDAVSEGFDIPEVSCGLLLRPTLSWAKCIQQMGRVCRIAPWADKRDGLILDIAGNVLRHGFLEDFDSFELLPSDSDRNSEPGIPPRKNCPNCHEIVHASVMVCPKCHHQFPAPEKREAILGNLKELPNSQEQKKITALRSLCKEAYRRGNSPDWAFLQWGAKSLEEWEGLSERGRYALMAREDIANFLYQHSRGAVFGGKDTPALREDYKRYLKMLAAKKGKGLDWIIKKFAREFGIESVAEEFGQ